MRTKLIRKRKGLGLTQQDVADKLGVTRTAVSAWEVGRNSPDIVEIIKLKKILEITEDEFFLDSDGTISEQEDEDEN